MFKAKPRPESGTFAERHALLSIVRREASWPTIEGVMATEPQGRIVETAREARGAEPGPSVLLLMVISVALAVLVLGGAWFVFFRT